MARDFMSGRNSVLKNIAEKKMLDDAPIMIGLEKLKEHPDNEWLFGMQGIHHMKQGIEENGWKGAIEVWDNGDGSYTIYSGHRRYKAVKELGWKEIRAFVYKMPEKETTKRRELLGANLFGRNSINGDDPIHTARQIAYHRQTLDMERELGIYTGGETRGELAKDFGISQTQIHRYESLLKLTETMQERVANKDIQFGQAANMAILNEEKQEDCWNAIVALRAQRGEDNVSRNDIQKIIDFMKNDEEESKDAELILDKAFPVSAPVEPVSEDVETPKEQSQIKGQLEIVDTEMTMREVDSEDADDLLNDLSDDDVESDDSFPMNVPVEDAEEENNDPSVEPVQEYEQGEDGLTFIDPDEQEKHCKKIVTVGEKMEDFLTEYYDFEDEWKEKVGKMYVRLINLMKSELERMGLD